MVYDRGDMVIVGNHTATGAAAFTDVAGTATDPTAVKLTVQKPDGTELEYGWPSAGATDTLTKQSTGRFYFLVSVDTDGVWYSRLVGTGASEAAAEGAFYVQPSNVLSI